MEGIPDSRKQSYRPTRFGKLDGTGSAPLARISGAERISLSFRPRGHPRAVQTRPAPFAKASAKVTQEAGEEPADLINRTTVGVEGMAGHGATWVASLANRLSVDLSNGKVGMGGSLANLTITQPLLRGASRRIYMEGLTQSERSLLMDARRLEQFRQGFFLKVVLGANPASKVGSGGSISFISPPSTGVSGFLGWFRRFKQSEIRKLMSPN